MTGVKQLAVTALLAAALALTTSSLAWSHHSHAMFDHDNEVTVTGTVSFNCKPMFGVSVEWPPMLITVSSIAESSM